MVLNMTETTSRYSLHAARAFADKYKDATSEKQLAQSFWRDFFHSVIGVEDLFAAGIEFEHPSVPPQQVSQISLTYSGAA